jgi:hypothetical protein
MAELSNFLENELIDHILRNAAWASPTTIYVALYTSDPTDADTGTEVTGGSYARQSVAFNAPSDGATDNTSDITFPTATAAWGTVTHVGLRDAVSGGNLLFHSPLTASKVVGNGDTFKFNAGDLDVSLA